MGLCVAIIGKPAKEAQVKTWATPDQMQCVLATAPLTNLNIKGSIITGDRLCFEGIDCRSVAGAVLYECNDSPDDCTRVYDLPLKMHWEQTDEGFCILPCFDEGECCDDPADEEPDYMAHLCEDPCQRWARLHYQLDELTMGQQLQAGTSNGRTKQFNVNFDKQCKELNRMISEARTKCWICNPCFKVGRAAKKLFISIPRH